MELACLYPMKKELSMFMAICNSPVKSWAGCQKLRRHERGRDHSALALFYIPFSKLLHLVWRKDTWQCETLAGVCEIREFRYPLD